MVRDSILRAADGTVSQVGIYWLLAGRNTFGHSEGNSFVFNVSGLQDHIGSYILDKGKVSLELYAGSNTLVNGKPFNGTIQMTSINPPQKINMRFHDLVFDEKWRSFSRAVVGLRECKFCNI